MDSENIFMRGFLFRILDSIKNSKLIPDISKKKGAANMPPKKLIVQNVTEICAVIMQRIANPRPISTDWIR